MPHVRNWISLALFGGLNLACDPGGFKTLESPVTQDLRGVFVERSDLVLAAGTLGTIAQYDGEQVTETSTDADPGPRVPDFYGIVRAADENIVVGDFGFALSRPETDYQLDDSRTNERLLVAATISEDLVYAAGENGRLISKQPGNRQWQRVNVPANDAKITGIWSNRPGSNDPEQVILTTDQGTIIERTNNNWARQEVMTATSTLPLPLFDAWSAGADEDLWVVGLSGRILRRPKGEQTWELVASPTAEDLYGIHGRSRDDIYAVGSRGTIVRYDGTEWTGFPSGTGEDLFAIHGDPENELVVAVGRRGVMLVLRP